MKSFKKIGAVCVLVFALAASVSAQQFQKGMTVGGATGLFVLPTGRIGWEKSQFGFDVGYGGYFGQDFKNYGNLIKLNFSLFKKLDLGAAWDAEMFRNNSKGTFHNVMINAKFQAFKNGSTSLAIGGNVQFNQLGNEFRKDYIGGQVYVAATYSGSFFEWPASTTLVFGKSFADPVDWNFDLGLGFELTLFPKAFKDYVSLIIELGNFSYVTRTAGNTGLDASSRGIANVGLRIDPIKGKNFKLGIDIIGTDLLDKNRSLGLQACFGLAI